MADLCMNCNRTVSGWFEVKSVVNGSWGGDITQVSPCEGTAPLSERSSSFTSTNHIGRCGRANLFIRNSASCIINDVDFRYTPRVTQPTTVRDTTVGTRVSSTTNEISTTSAPSCPSGMRNIVPNIRSAIQNTCPDGAVAMSLANRLVGTGFASRYRFQTRVVF